MQFVGSKVVTAVLMRSVALNVGTPCGSERARRFERNISSPFSGPENKLSMKPAETGGELRYTKLFACYCWFLALLILRS